MIIYANKSIKLWANATSANIYLLKFINRNTIQRWEICSKLTIKTPERRQHVLLNNCSSNYFNFKILGTSWNKLEPPGTRWAQQQTDIKTKEFIVETCVQCHCPIEYNISNSYCHKELRLRCWQGVPDPALLYICFK